MSNNSNDKAPDLVELQIGYTVIQFFKKDATEPFMVKSWPVVPLPGEQILVRDEANPEDGVPYVVEGRMWTIQGDHCVIGLVLVPYGSIEVPNHPMEILR